MAKTNNKTNKKYIFIIISLILIIISCLINASTAIRPILFILSCLIISIISAINKNNKFIIGSITFILTLILSVFIDSIVVFTFKTIPAFSYNIISYDNIKVYNSFGIRVWQCDKSTTKDLKVDPFYKKGYMCDISDTDAINSNSFLNSVVENYKTYKNNYIKIEGKISKKSSQNLIEMQPYEESSITVNGYVAFADNITLRILFNEAESILDNYDVYDDITIVGIIKNMEQENNKYVIYMSDSKVVSDVNLDEYILSVTPSQTCGEDKPLFQNNNMNISTHCIDDIIIDYGTKKYELATLLSSGKIQVSELYQSPDNEEKNEEGDTIYYNDSYNVIVCNPETSNNIIISSDKTKLTDVTCTRKSTE